jgi:hypothetical protein
MAEQRHTGRSSVRPRHSRISAEQFGLTGPSDLPDPAFNAFRKDLADTALAGRVIASHYASPVEHSIESVTALRTAPEESAEAICQLAAGTPFALLDDSRGWAWGYAGDDRRVGYVRSSALT